MVPETIGKGVGKSLFHRAARRVKDSGAGRSTIDSDPNSVAFYWHMGSGLIGASPSGSLPERLLPKLRYVIEGALTQPALDRCDDVIIAARGRIPD